MTLYHFIALVFLFAGFLVPGFRAKGEHLDQFYHGQVNYAGPVGTFSLVAYLEAGFNYLIFGFGSKAVEMDEIFGAQSGAGGATAADDKGRMDKIRHEICLE